MRRILIGISIAIVIAIVAGCGGGGTSATDTSGTGSTSGTGGTGDTGSTTTTRTITGQIVSSQGGGVANVTVELGASGLTGTTNASGTYSITVSSTLDIPYYFTVDTSAAGSNYSTGTTLTYNGQKYLAEKVLTSAAVRNSESNSIGTITLQYLAADDVPAPPYESHDTIISGRVVDSNGSGIANVTISFGTPAFTAKTGSKGYFSINLGLDAAVLPLFPASPKYFAINTATAGASYPVGTPVTYQGVTSDQSSLELPLLVLTNQDSDLGTIRVNTSAGSGSGDGGDGPPPIPTI